MCYVDWSALALVILIGRIGDYLIKKYDFERLPLPSTVYLNHGQVPLYDTQLPSSSLLKSLSCFPLAAHNSSFLMAPESNGTSV